MRGSGRNDACSRAVASCVSVFLLAAPRCAVGQLVSTLAGSGLKGRADGVGQAASFSSPTGVAVDGSGNVYVADTSSFRIRKISAKGSVSTLPGYEPDRSFPYGVAVDGLGNVYVAEPGDGENYGAIKMVTPAGVVTALWGNLPIEPASVAVDASANVYFVDYSRGLLKSTPDGGVMTLADGLGFSSGVAVDTAGNVYVANTDRHTVSKVTPGGVVSLLAGSGEEGTADGMGSEAGLNSPGGLAVDRAGNVYVADSGNHLIRKITATGVVTTLAGTGRAGSTDGLGRSASFNLPTGLALDCAGNLYVADRGNNKIRRITVADGVVGAACETSWIVPSTARVPGAHGSFWTSDLTIHNRGSEAVAATLRFLGNGEDTRGRPETRFTLEPFGSITMPDVLASAFGIGTGFGAIQLVARSDRLVVRSRNSTAGPGGSVGDNVPGLPVSAFFSDLTPESPVLTGLKEDDAFRSNVVLVNGSGFPVTILVRASDGAGAPLGERTYEVPPLGMIQDSRFLLRPEFGGEKRSNATVTISSPTPGALFTALASVIDNTSNDPTTVLPQ